MRRYLPALLLPAVLVAGCGGDGEAASQVPPVPGAQTPATTATVTQPVDAGTVVKKLADADLGLTGAAVQDENTDPNNLLGRPNGYLSRASADLPDGDKNADKAGIDRGLVVEVFGDAGAAKARSEHIQGLLKASPLLGTEWHYFTGEGRALVRVSGDVKPSLAKKVEAAVGTL